MADLKLFHSQALLQALTPYEHELNYSGSGCAHDCPACRWIQRTSDAPWSDAVLNSDADDTRYVAAALRLYWEHSGMREEGRIVYHNEELSCGHVRQEFVGGNLSSKRRRRRRCL